MLKAKHIVKLNGFDIEQGKISFLMLEQLTKLLKKLAAGTLKLYLFGASSSKKASKHEGFKESLDFQLAGLEKGSTILEIEAPTLGETLHQLPLFAYLGVEKPNAHTALSLAFNTISNAFLNTPKGINPDKHLLKEILSFNSLFHHENSHIDFSFGDEVVSLNKQNFERVKRIEESIPSSRKTKVVGKLDVLKFSSLGLEIIVNNRKIRAALGDRISMDEVMPFFGKDVSVIGVANFGPNKQIASIEVESLAEATQNDEYFRKFQMPIFATSDLKDLNKSKGYEGTSLDQIAGQWPGDEPLDDLLSMLTK